MPGSEKVVIMVLDYDKPARVRVICACKCGASAWNCSSTKKAIFSFTVKTVNLPSRERERSGKRGRETISSHPRTHWRFEVIESNIISLWDPGRYSMWDSFVVGSMLLAALLNHIHKDMKCVFVLSIRLHTQSIDPKKMSDGVTHPRTLNS